jgi:oxygen-dependent protoporphyrinogen oxidase
LGREFLDYAINPFVAGVYAGDPEQLSVRAAFPKLYALEREYRSLIIGQIRGARKRRQRAETAKDRARLFSFRSGMQRLPNALATALADDYRGGASVSGLKREEGGWSVETAEGGPPIVAKTVLTAVPTRETARLWSQVEPSLPGLLEQIPYPPVAEVFLGFRRDQVSHPLDGFGFLVPQLEHRSILGTLWSSTLFPGRAPDGHVALTTFVGGSRQPELAGLADGPLIDAVVGDLRPILGVNGQPVYVRINRWERAIPQYAIGHLDIVERLRAVESRHPGLFMAGNFIGGISVGDCVIQSDVNASRIDAYLRQIEHRDPGAFARLQ